MVVEKQKKNNFDDLAGQIDIPPGMLNDINPPLVGSTNFLNVAALDPQVLRRYVYEKAQEVDALSGIDYLQGIVLRVETTEGLAADATLAAMRKTFAIESEEKGKLLRARVRIPELHVHLPAPSEKGHDQYPKKKKPVDDIIDLYPLCEAHDLPDVGFNVGDIVTVGFHNIYNSANAPRILSKVGPSPVPDFPGLACAMQNQYSALSGQVDALNTNKQLLSGHTGTTQAPKRARTNNAAALVVSDKYFMKGALHKLAQEELQSRGYIMPDSHIEIIEDTPLVAHIESLEGTLLGKKEAGGLHTVIYQFDEVFTPDVEDFASLAMERNQVMKVLSAIVSKIAHAAVPAQIILIGTTKTQMRKISQPGNTLIENIMNDAEFRQSLPAGLSDKLVFINPLDSVYTPGQNLEDRSGLWTAAAYATNGPFPKAAMLKIVNQIKKMTSASPPVENKKPAPPEVSKKQPKMPNGYNIPDSLKMLLEERTFTDKNEAVEFLKSIATQLGWEAATDEPLKLTVTGVAGSQPHWKDLIAKKSDEILTEENIALILGLARSLDEQTFVAMKKSIEYKIGAAKDIYNGKAPTQDPPPAAQPSPGPPVRVCDPATMPPGFSAPGLRRLSGKETDAGGTGRPFQKPAPKRLSDIDFSRYPQWMINKWGTGRGFSSRWAKGDDEVKYKTMMNFAAAEVLERYWKQLFPECQVFIKSHLRPGSPNHGNGAAMDWEVRYGGGKYLPNLYTWASSHYLMHTRRLPPSGGGTYLNMNIPRSNKYNPNHPPA